jgi:hypothetical protein
MSTQEEILKIRFQAEGDAAIKRAQAELEKLEKAAGRAAEKFRAGTLDQARFGKAAEMLGGQIAAARAKLEAFEKASGKAGGQKRNLGMAALEAGRALEDLNYGLVGVMNNIPQLALALGAGAGLTGVIGILGAAVLFLSRNWESVSEKFAVGVPNETITSLEKARSELEKINGELEKIAAKPRLSVAERIRAGTLKLRKEDLEREVGRDEAIGRAFEGKSDREAEVARVVGDLVRNSGLDRRDFTGMVARAAGGTAAGRELLSDALQGNEGSARQLARLLQARGNGTRAAQLGQALGVGLAGNPSAADFGPTRADLEAGLEAREAARRREARDAEALERENRANADRYARDRDRRAAELAGPLRQRFDDERLAGRAIDAGQVRGELERAGLGAAEAAELAGPVLTALMEGLEARVRERALQRGETPEAAEAGLATDRRRQVRLEALGRRGEALRRQQELMADWQAQAGNRRPSEVMDIGRVAESIQQAVGGVNYQQQAVNELAKLVKINERMERDLRDVGRLR